MIPTWTPTRLLLILALVCLPGPSATHQLNAQQDNQTPVFRTEANYVRVDVYPLANDAPVMDLQQEDFEVREDGVPQRIEAFSRVLIRGPSGRGSHRTQHGCPVAIHGGAEPGAAVRALS